MSSRQKFFLMAIALPTYKLSMLPSYAYSISGRDSWLTILCMLLLDVGVLCMIYIVKSRVGILNFDSKIANSVMKGLAVVFCAYFIFQTALLATETIEYSVQVFFDGAKRLQLIIPLILSAVYIGYKGAKTVGRCADIFIWGLVITLGISLVFNSATPDIDNLFPVLDERGGDKLLSGYNIFLWFGDYLPFLFIDLKDRKKVSTTPIVFGALLISVCVSAVFAIFTMQWGESTEFVPNAFARLAGYNFISADVGKADWIAVLNWIGSCALKLGLNMLGAINAFTYAFGEKTRKTFSISVIFVLVGLLHFVFTDVAKEFSIGVGARFIGFILNIVLPFIICVISTLCKKTVKEKVEDPPRMYVTEQDYMDEKGANVCANS